MISKYNAPGSFKTADNRTDEENELIKLLKENKQLRMENDILKLAALIMGRKLILSYPIKVSIQSAQCVRFLRFLERHYITSASTE